MICDAVKRAVDYVALRPYATAFAVNRTQVRVALEKAYKIGRRRMEVIEREAAAAAEEGRDVPESWADLSPEVKGAESRFRRT